MILSSVTCLPLSRDKLPDLYKKWSIRSAREPGRLHTVKSCHSPMDNTDQIFKGVRQIHIIGFSVLVAVGIFGRGGM